MNDYLFRIGVSSTKSDIFVVQDCPVKITVWGMAPTDVIEFEEVQRTDTSQLSANGTCCIVSTGGVTVTDTLPYLVDCTCVPQGSLAAPRIWIDQPGYYRAVLKDTGGGAPTGEGLANVQVMKDCMSVVNSTMRGCCPPPPEPPVTVYCPSQPLLEGGFGYHDADPKDPAATVEIAPCVGDTSVDSIWVYPSASPGNTALVTDCDDNVIGYGANQSMCAVTCPCPDLSVTVNNQSPVNNVTVQPPVNNFSPTTNVAAPTVVNNIPAAPRSVTSFAWNGDNLIVTYSDGTNQTITSPMCS